MSAGGYGGGDASAGGYGFSGMGGMAGGASQTGGERETGISPLDWYAMAQSGVGMDAEGHAMPFNYSPQYHGGVAPFGQVIPPDATGFSAIEGGGQRWTPPQPGVDAGPPPPGGGGDYRVYDPRGSFAQMYGGGGGGGMPPGAQQGMAQQQAMQAAMAQRQQAIQQMMQQRQQAMGSLARGPWSGLGQ
jgi:hypothetical protein